MKKASGEVADELVAMVDPNPGHAVVVDPAVANAEDAIERNEFLGHFDEVGEGVEFGHGASV